MKYLVFALCLLPLAACKPPAQPKAKTYVCFNPFMPIQSVQLDTDHPRVKETATTLSITTEDGTVVTFPKSLCVEVKKAGE